MLTGQEEKTYYGTKMIANGAFKHAMFGHTPSFSQGQGDTGQTCYE